MQKIQLAQGVQVRRITPVGDGHHYFYGYYDTKAFSQDGRYHLFHRVAFRDRLPKPQDYAELGYVDLQDGSTHIFARTQAWNFQQGSMLQWRPGHADEVVYNAYFEGAYRAVLQNIRSGTKRLLDYPVATLSPDGKYALSVNFSRIYDFRPGYGYPHIQDLWRDVPIPPQDGVTLLELASGKGELLLSYPQMAQVFGNAQTAGRKCTVNHITFSGEANRFVFLLRCPDPNGKDWQTGVGTADISGKTYRLRPYTHASHYHWRDGETLLIYGDCGTKGKGAGLYALRDKTQEYHLFDPQFFTQDIHCSYSPDKKNIIGDAYPDKNGYRSIYFYSITEQQGNLLGSVYSPKTDPTDIRCDLHLRWHPSGKSASFDSVHEGERAIYLLDFHEIL